jgi:hypothetical protein
MKVVEQEIWDYLDGSLSEQKRVLIEGLIESDPIYRSVYEELSSLNNDLGSLELDEPSMSFNRNLMEKIALEPSPGLIRSLIDKRIIYGISAFFILTIVCLLAVMFVTTDWSSGSEGSSFFEMPEFNYSVLLSSTVINTFLFMDVIVAMLFIDGFLRKRMNSKKL